MTRKNKELTFEAAMARLEEITQALERGDLALEEALAYFKEGTALIEHCQSLLDAAEKTLQLLEVGETQAAQKDE
ncbi:MAG: exodeoxyribonuclease VII small subunit [Desulfofundulus sp.]